MASFLDGLDLNSIQAMLAPTEQDRRGAMNAGLLQAGLAMMQPTMSGRFGDALGRGAAYGLQAHGASLADAQQQREAALARVAPLMNLQNAMAAQQKQRAIEDAYRQYGGDQSRQVDLDRIMWDVDPQGQAQRIAQQRATQAAAQLAADERAYKRQQDEREYGLKARELGFKEDSTATDQAIKMEQFRAEQQGKMAGSAAQSAKEQAADARNATFDAALAKAEDILTNKPTYGGQGILSSMSKAYGENAPEFLLSDETKAKNVSQQEMNVSAGAMEASLKQPGSGAVSDADLRKAEGDIGNLRDPKISPEAKLAALKSLKEIKARQAQAAAEGRVIGGDQAPAPAASGGVAIPQESLARAAKARGMTVEQLQAQINTARRKG